MSNDNKNRIVCFGEILWDIFPNRKLLGGAPMNVAYHLSLLDKNPILISKIGNDQLAEELLSILKSKKIDQSFIQLDRDNPTGRVIAEVQENNEVHYQIENPSAWDFICWKDDFINNIANAEYFVFGSLITRNNQSRDTLLKCLEIAKTKVFDINLRPPYFDQNIITELLLKTDILKLNISELHLISDWFSNFKNDEERISFIAKKFNIKITVVTKGSDGAILFTDNCFFYHRGFHVIVADTVGSGDSFLAAMISKLMDHSTPDEILEFANATGAFIASCYGGCPEYEIQNVHDLIKNENSKYV